MFLIKGVNVMDEILNLSINEMPQTEFDCSCGKHHNKRPVFTAYFFHLFQQLKHIHVQKPLIHDQHIERMPRRQLAQQAFAAPVSDTLAKPFHLRQIIAQNKQRRRII